MRRVDAINSGPLSERTCVGTPRDKNKSPRVSITSATGPYTFFGKFKGVDLISFDSKFWFLFRKDRPLEEVSSARLQYEEDPLIEEVKQLNLSQLNEKAQSQPDFQYHKVTNIFGDKDLRFSKAVTSTFNSFNPSIIDCEISVAGHFPFLLSENRKKIVDLLKEHFMHPRTPDFLH